MYLKYEYSEETTMTGEDGTTLMFKSLSRIDCERGTADVDSLAWSVPKLYSDADFLNGFLYGKVKSDGQFTGRPNFILVIAKCIIGLIDDR